VRWIETQNDLFSRTNENAISRAVEIGPTETLAGMARRTVEAQFALKDMLYSRERHILSIARDGKAISYEYDSPALSTGPENLTEITPPSSSPLQTSAIHILAQTPDTIATPRTTSETSIPYVPISAKEILQSLVAQKLKRGFQEIPQSKSIKELSGG